MKVTIFLQPSKPEMENSSPVLVLESGLEYGSSVLEYSKRCTWTRTRVVAVLGLVLEYRREVLVLRLDLRLPVLEIDSYSEKVDP